jgi:hypothetical protein
MLDAVVSGLLLALTHSAPHMVVAGVSVEGKRSIHSPIMKKGSLRCTKSEI